MKKTEMIATLAEEFGLTKSGTKQLLERIVQMACDGAKRDGEFAFPGLGKLVKAHRKARVGRNPATGESVNIPAKTVVKFRLSKLAKDAVLG